MDRRIRVKCPECAASIEMRVDQQELLDVTCPRCQKMFTAKVPPLALDILPVIELEPEETKPPVRPTRVVQQKPATRPRRIREIPQRSTSVSPAPASLDGSNWQLPTAQYQPGTHYQPAPRVSGATHVKAFLIAGGSVFAVGMLAMFGFMIKSALSTLDLSAAVSSTAPASTAEPVIVAPSPTLAAPTTSMPGTGSTSSSPLIPGLTNPAAPAGAAGANGPVESTTPSVNTNPVTAQQPVASSAPAASAGATVSNSTVRDKVTELATQYLDATKDLDGEFLLDRTHPKLIEQVGGRTTMLEKIQLEFAPFKKSGVTVISYKVSELVNMRQVDQNIFVVLPTQLKVNQSGRILSTDLFLLGVSEDGGKTFVFIDGPATKDRVRLKQILPQFPDDLALPSISAPREVSP